MFGYLKEDLQASFLHKLATPADRISEKKKLRSTVKNNTFVCEQI